MVTKAWDFRFIKPSSGHNRAYVPGAVNSITKEVIAMANTTFMNTGTIVAFLKRRKEYYGDVPLKVVLENARSAITNFFQEINRKYNSGLRKLLTLKFESTPKSIEPVWGGRRQEIFTTEVRRGSRRGIDYV